MDTTVSSGVMETHCPYAIVCVDIGRVPASPRASIASNVVSEYDSEYDRRTVVQIASPSTGHLHEHERPGQRRDMAVITIETMYTLPKESCVSHQKSVHGEELAVVTAIFSGKRPSIVVRRHML